MVLPVGPQNSQVVGVFLDDLCTFFTEFKLVLISLGPFDTATQEPPNVSEPVEGEDK